MKRQIILLIFLFISFNGCAKKTEKIELKSDETKLTTIKENISFVSAKILEVNKKSDTIYTTKIRILESTSDESLPNFAQVNEVIVAKPRFILNEIGSIDLRDQRNQNLIELSRETKDKVVKLILTRTLNEGWLIIDFQN